MEKKKLFSIVAVIVTCILILVIAYVIGNGKKINTDANISQNQDQNYNDDEEQKYIDDLKRNGAEKIYDAQEEFNVDEDKDSNEVHFDKIE